MRKKIVILGSKGLLGTDLMMCLGEIFSVEGVDITDFDVRDKKAVDDYLTDRKPDVVINCTVASANADQAEKDKETAFAVNAESVKHIAEACSLIRAKLIQFSSDYVFDGSKTTPYIETDTTHPLNIYGESKVLCEDYVQQILRDYLIIRSSWIFGSHGRNFVDTILKTASEEGRIKVVDDQFGCPTYSGDLAQAVKELIKKDAKGIIHITNQGNCSWYEFAQEIVKTAEISGVEIIPITTEQYAGKAKRPKYSVLDNSRLNTEYHYQMPPWQDALRKYFKETGR